MKKELTVLLLLLCHVNLQAQYARFEYAMELCECTADFDSTKYSRQQLQNTFEYMYFGDASSIDTYPVDFDEEPAALLDALEKECRQKLAFIRQLDIVDDSFWQDVRKKMIKYINSTRELRRVTIKARTAPKELLGYKLVDKNCRYFRDALIAGGDQLLKAWAKLIEMKKKHNADPDGMQRSFDSRYNSPEREEWAYRDVLTYGWWNYANRLLPHVTQKGYEKHFKKLLKDIRCECDD